MAEIKLYRTYEHYRDPVCDEIAGAIERENLLKKPAIVANIATVSPATVRRLLDRTTRRPHYATVMAIMGGFGLAPKGWARAAEFNVAEALKASKKWRERQEAKKENAKQRLIAARKAARAAGHAQGASAQKR